MHQSLYTFFAPPWARRGVVYSMRPPLYALAARPQACSGPVDCRRPPLYAFFAASGSCSGPVSCMHSSLYKSLTPQQAPRGLADCMPSSLYTLFARLHGLSVTLCNVAPMVLQRPWALHAFVALHTLGARGWIAGALYFHCVRYATHPSKPRRAFSGLVDCMRPPLHASPMSQRAC